MAQRIGMHGDYLKDGKLDLPELLEVPSTDDWAWGPRLHSMPQVEGSRHLSRNSSARVHGSDVGA